jgi:hypothetical protein
MQPHRCGAGAAVVQERDRTLRGGLVVGGVGDVEERRFGRARLRIAGDEVTGAGRVADGLAVQRDLVMGDGGLFDRGGCVERRARAGRIAVRIVVRLVRLGGGIGRTGGACCGDDVTSSLQAVRISEENTTLNNSFALLAGIVAFLLSNVFVSSSPVSRPRLACGR